MLLREKTECTSQDLKELKKNWIVWEFCRVRKVVLQHESNQSIFFLLPYFAW